MDLKEQNLWFDGPSSSDSCGLFSFGLFLSSFFLSFVCPTYCIPQRELQAFTVWSRFRLPPLQLCLYAAPSPTILLFSQSPLGHLFTLVASLDQFPVFCHISLHSSHQLNPSILAALPLVWLSFCCRSSDCITTLKGFLAPFSQIMFDSLAAFVPKHTLYLQSADVVCTVATRHYL